MTILALLIKRHKISEKHSIKSNSFTDHPEQKILTIVLENWKKT